MKIAYNNKPHTNTVKHFLFAKTLFSRKFVRAYRRENKILANNFLCVAFIRNYDKTRI